MRVDPTVTRRSVLAAGAAGAGAVALAACSSSSSKGDTAPGAPGGNGNNDTSGPADAPLAKLADIEVGKCVSAKLPDGKPAIVSRPTSDTAVAFSAKCTHMGCTVQPAGTELHCPCHGSKYNALTGAVLQGPAPEPLPKINVQVTNGEVVTG
jgi:cytochrome b6-f complex iron-sulfur subunit